MEPNDAPLASLGTVCCALMTVGVTAQTPQPYAGMETRPIKALSEQQIADLRTGRGMSLALAAELNGYPGPRHVLELAGQLNLSHQQLQNVKGLFEEMTAEAVALGQTLIRQETSPRKLKAHAKLPRNELLQGLMEEQVMQSAHPHCCARLVLATTIVTGAGAPNSTPNSKGAKCRLLAAAVDAA